MGVSNDSAEKWTFTGMSVLFVDNCCGFSYYFVQSYKLDYIVTLENARLKYADDKVVSQELDRLMVNALNRWTVYNALTDIFQKTFSTTSEAREQKIAEEIAKNKNDIKKIETAKTEESHDVISILFPVAERSPFWHTLCSSFDLIMIALLFVLYIMLSPFIHDTNKKNSLLGMCVLLPFLIGVIFFIQWILSLIPDIAGRPRINNIIYLSVNIILLILLTKNIKKK